jgi:hypothetical protein
VSRLADSIICCVLVLVAARAGSDETAPAVVFPTLPAQAQSQAGLVPAGWIVETESHGDLNGDGAPDLVLVLHMTSPANVITNDGLGWSELDTNPRMLVVAFAEKATKKYSLALANHTLIPRHTNPLMDDPLGEVAIVKGTVQVSLGFWMSAGSWFTSQNKFTFRYQDGCFKLIGYDSTGTQRNSGEMTKVSINYLTKKAKTSKGNVENDQETVSWKTVRVPSLLCLDAVGDGLEFEPEI